MAIVMIVIHNVIHVNFNVAENEFAFSSQNVAHFIEQFPRHPFLASISFLGWLGVSVFVFCSGYGLAVKYKEPITQKCRWVLHHYLKLFLLLIGALILFKLYPVIREPHAIDFANLTLEALLALNITNPSAISPMIYWYIGMAFQLYLCFLLLKDLPVKPLLLIGILIAAGLGFMPNDTVYYLRHNCVGWLIEFIFGIAIARCQIKPLNKTALGMIALASISMAVVCSFSRQTFCLSGVCISVFFLTLMRPITRIKPIVYLGAISASIYVLHSLARQALTYIIAWNHFEIGAIAKALIVLAVSILAAVPYQWLYNRITTRLTPPN